MKKYLTVLLTVVMLFTVSCGKKGKKTDTTPTTDPTVDPVVTEMVTPTPTEEAEPLPEWPAVTVESLCGTWYGNRGGLIMTLQLNADGTYTMNAPLEDEPVDNGKWTFSEPVIYLGGEAGECLDVLSYSLIHWEVAGIDFTREKQVIYVPDEIEESVPQEFFEGSWRSEYVSIDDMMIDSALAGDNTEIYIMGNRVALGGTLFRDAVVDMSFANGKLSWSAEDVSIVLNAQRDGMLRLTFSANSETVVLYLTAKE